MGEPSMELLHLPSDPKPPCFISASSSSPSNLLASLVLAFLFCDVFGLCVRFAESLFAGREQQHKEEGKRKAGPPTNPLPKSQVLGKMKDFLGEVAKANEKLQLDAQNKPPEEYDIEALTGNEKEYIEMDLLLGVADLHSEQAIDAAEATMSGFPPSGRSFASSSSDSEDDSDEDGGDEPDISSEDKCIGLDEPETHPAKGKMPNKRQKIVVLN